MGNNSTNNQPLSQSTQATSTGTFNGIEGKLEEQPITKGKSFAEGFGKLSHTIQDIITKIEDKIDRYYYGKSNATNISSKTGKFINPLDYGLINVVKLLSSVDLCSLFTYLSSNIPGSTAAFDPEKNKSEEKTTFGRVKYNLQYSAYQIQGYIDKFYSDYSDLNSITSRTALGNILAQVKQILENLVGVDSQEVLKNPELLKAFPQITIFENGINNLLIYYNKYSDVRNLPQTDLKKVLSYVDKTRDICVAIQGLSTPKDVLAFIDNQTNGTIQDQLKKLDKLINPKDIAKVVKSILKTLQNIQNICNQIISYVNLGRLVIQLSLILIFVLKIINKFFTAIGIPNVFTWAGLSTKLSEANGKIVDRIDYFSNRLQEISIVLDSLFNLINDIILKLQQLSDALKMVLSNLENCNNIDPTLVSDLSESIKTIDSTVNTFQKYIDTYNNNKKNRTSSFGGYTIQILTEELTDEGIARKRRYGIALDSLQQQVVQSIATFASDDNIIIQEVKLLLIAKNLVKVSGGTLTAKELGIYEEASNYLEDSQIDINKIEDINIDVNNDDSMNDNEDEGEDEADGDSLNINAFVNKLKGGRRLRRRMRRMLAKQKRQLSESLQAADPNNKLKNKEYKKQKKSAIEEEIKADQELIKIYKEDIKRYIVLLTSAPILYGIRIKRRKNQIKELENRIKDLEKQKSKIK